MKGQLEFNRDQKSIASLQFYRLKLLGDNKLVHSVFLAKLILLQDE